MHFWQEHHGSNVEVNLAQYWRGWVYNLVKVVSADFLQLLFLPRWRPPATWRGAYRMEVVPPPPGACGGEAHRIDPRRLAPPPPAWPQTRGGTASRLSHRRTQEPAHRPRRAAPAARAKSEHQLTVQRLSPARIQRPKVLGGRHQRRPCQQLLFFP